MAKDTARGECGKNTIPDWLRICTNKEQNTIRWILLLIGWESGAIFKNITRLTSHQIQPDIERQLWWWGEQVVLHGVQELIVAERCLCVLQTFFDARKSCLE